MTLRIKLTAGADGGEAAAKSHLVRLSEFYAMYLFAWSDVLWPKASQDGLWLAFPEYQTLYPPGQAVPPGGQQAASYATEVERLGLFTRTLPKVRRALANVPTYMVFDDHEVTDDWNLNREWCARVYDEGNALGRRLVQNALTACAIFQAWGSAPERFVAGQPGAAISTAAAGWYGGSAPDQVSKSQALQQRLRVPLYRNGALVPPGAGDPAPLAWHFQLAGPGFEVLALDTRTQRAFPGRAPGPPRAAGRRRPGRPDPRLPLAGGRGDPPGDSHQPGQRVPDGDGRGGRQEATFRLLGRRRGRLDGADARLRAAALPPRRAAPGIPAPPAARPGWSSSPGTSTTASPSASSTGGSCPSRPLPGSRWTPSSPS